MKVYVFGCFEESRGHGFVGYHGWDYSVRHPLQVWADGSSDGVPEGHACVRKNSRLGVTGLDWPDRKGDSRPGSHTVVMVFADVTGEELLALARKQVPWAFRVNVEIQPWAVGP